MPTRKNTQVFLDTDFPLTGSAIQKLNNFKLFKISRDLIIELGFTELDIILIENFIKKNSPNAYAGVLKVLDRSGPRIKFAPLTKDDCAIKKGEGSTFDLNKQVSGKLDEISIRTETSFSIKIGSVTETSMGTFHSFREEPIINLSAKNDLANEECAHLCQAIMKIRRTTKIQQKKLNVTIKELKLTNQEIIDTQKAFEEYVVIKGVDKMTKKVPSECAIKFFESWLKLGNALIEKMRLQTATLNQNYVNQKKLLALKEELSGILRPIDFEQLSIEKKNSIRIIDEKKSNLIGLKRLTGKTSKALETEAEVLQGTLSDLLNLKKNISEKDVTMKKYENEEIVCNKEIDEVNEKIENLEKMKDTYVAPTVLEYVYKKKELGDLKKQGKRLVREKYIGQIKLENMKKKLTLQKKHEKQMLNAF